MMLSKVTTEWGIDGTIINRVAILTTWVMSSVQKVVTLREVVSLHQTTSLKVTTF